MRAPDRPLRRAPRLTKTAVSHDACWHLRALSWVRRRRVARPLNYAAASSGQRRRRDRTSPTRYARHARAGGTHMNFISRIRTIVREESGQDLIEYAMLVA